MAAFHRALESVLDKGFIYIWQQHGWLSLQEAGVQSLVDCGFFPSYEIGAHFGIDGCDGEFPQEWFDAFVAEFDWSWAEKRHQEAKTETKFVKKLSYTRGEAALAHHPINQDVEAGLLSPRSAAPIKAHVTRRTMPS